MRGEGSGISHAGMRSTLIRGLSMLRALPLFAAILVVGLAPAASVRAEPIPANFKLLYEQNFEKPESINDFVFTDPTEWKLGSDASNTWLELSFPKGKHGYAPKHRSPFHIALIADRVFGDFILEADMQSTMKPYPHQDMCLFYGFTNPDRFYYTHIAVAADPHAHNIFIVKDAPRKAIARETTKGITWQEGKWHKVRIERKSAEGTIRVWFDDMSKPLMVTEDKTFPEGHVGVGSFDDTGRIDNIRIWGTKMEAKKTEFFRRAAK
jgi:hypothetical protein